ncbi:MAG TPA: hypothetical protein VLF18_20895 [Tahibacter sp.]|uniref:hypothetical protein n=1 Tax=Tahibacter sp. TaxID=2056211 RepID=UPI002C989099|nr:hypothetical protein [Tahibacter sp.]HSX62648.1 hypothetical protein [Tahibacter sp.]
MSTVQTLLHRCLVGIAMIFSAGVGAAGLQCTSTSEGYRCEAWPQGADYRYEWHLAAHLAVTDADLDLAHRRLRCPSGHASAIAVTVIAPAGYVESATQLLPACSELGAGNAGAALASSF